MNHLVVELALSLQNEWQFVTADERLIRKLKASRDSRLHHLAISLTDAANA